MLKFIRTATLVTLPFLAGCSAIILNSEGRTIGQPLPPCSNKPNCVNSESGGDRSVEHVVEPFSINGDIALTWQAAKQAVANSERTTVIFEQDDYLHAEVLSPWRVYTDDLALRLDIANKVIHLRSSSRVGYSDFGVNRKRVAALKTAIASELEAAE